jgi:hypothetical protein
MRALILCALTAAGCHRGTTRSPAPIGAPTALVILEARHGLLVVDPAATTVRPVAGYERLDWFAIQRRGPYVTFGRSDVPYVIDLRDIDYGPVVFEELRQTIIGAAAMSAGRRDTVVATITEQGDLRVTVIEPRGGVNAPKTLAAPAANLDSVLVSPGGATLAVVAGPRAEVDPPQDLFTIRVSDGATRRWTTQGDVIDAAFVDDDHVAMVVQADDAFELVTLATGEVHRIVVPPGWTAGRFDAYVGWNPGTLFDHDTTGTAPLPAGQRAKDRRAVRPVRTPRRRGDHAGTRRAHRGDRSRRQLGARNHAVRRPGRAHAALARRSGAGAARAARTSGVRRERRRRRPCPGLGGVHRRRSLRGLRGAVRRRMDRACGRSGGSGAHGARVRRSARRPRPAVTSECRAPHRRLIELLEEQDPDAEVCMVTQPGWPMEYSLAGVAARADLLDDDVDPAEQERYRDGTAANDVVLVEGKWLRYARRTRRVVR